jgi:hypothetical protein
MTFMDLTKPPMSGGEYHDFGAARMGRLYYQCLDAPELSPADPERVDDILIDCLGQVLSNEKCIDIYSPLGEVIKRISSRPEQFVRIPSKCDGHQGYYMGTPNGDDSSSDEFHEGMAGLLLLSRIKHIQEHPHTTSIKGLMACILRDCKLGVFDISGHFGGSGLEQGESSSYQHFNSELLGVLECK